MPWTWQLERRYWHSEWMILWRRGKWAIAGTLGLAFLGTIPGTPGAFDWAVSAILGLFATRRVVAADNLEQVLSKRWKRASAAFITQSWPGLVVALGLTAKAIGGGVISPGIGKPRWEGDTCVVPVSLPRGLGREDLVARADRIAQAFAARRVLVAGDHIHALQLRVEYSDALAAPFTLPFGGPWDGRTVTMGITSLGTPWRLRLGPHTLVAGSSGSGKASLVWGLLLGLAQPIQAGVVEVWGVDRKGGMELAMGRRLLTRFADDAPTSVVLLEDAVEAMQVRARQLAGWTRQHVPTTESPTIIVLIDELAALTAYETDRDLQRRANAAIATLASQGRAVGFIVFACLQDPRKETLPARGLFTQTVGLRLRDGMETAMVLGDGAVAAGALCHTISTTTPGVAYVLPEDGSPPERVRAGLITDAMIREAAARFPSPRQKPVVVPEPPVAAEQPTRAPRQPRRSTRKEPS